MKRIGFIGDTAFSPSYLERYRGYQRALREHNLTNDPTIEITEIEESQGALFNSLKNIKQMPDAWFCVNSGLAFMLNSYLQSSGYTIPKDISVICFDETEFTRMAIPQLTNIATDLQFMGQLAIRTLVHRIAHPQEPIVHQQIVPQLNIRESVRLIKTELKQSAKFSHKVEFSALFLLNLLYWLLPLSEAGESPRETRVIGSSSKPEKEGELILDCFKRFPSNFPKKNNLQSRRQFRQGSTDRCFLL